MATLFATHPLDLPLGPARSAAPTKPLLRGRLHQVCCGLSVPAGASLIGSAPTATARAVAVVFAASWTAMFATSATYHCAARSSRARYWMRRADHSMIFVHIAGAATPLCVLAVPRPLSWVLLATMWAGALAGVATKATRLSEDCKAGSWFYLPLASVVAVVLPFLAPVLGWRTGLLVGAGVAYGVGAVLFFRKRPDPIPTIFGYHEVWHCFTAVGGICQFLAIQALVTAG